MILSKFCNIYDAQIKPQIDYIIKNSECDWEPIIYTLDKGRNRFRSALAVLSGNINKLDPKISSTLGAICELLHTAIIIQDDISDRDDFRRGDIAAWKRFGIDRALFSCEQIIAIAMLNSISILKDKITSFLLQIIFEINQGQSMQARSNFKDDLSEDIFQKMYHYKTALGRWAITGPCKINSNDRLFCVFDQFARLLGEAGSVKNDLENIILDNRYDSTSMDLSIGRPTLPLLLLVKSVPTITESHGRLTIKQLLYDNGVYDSCKINIERCVKQAIQLLQEVPQSKDKELLIEWAEYHLCV